MAALSGKQKAEANVKAVEKWIADRDEANDFNEYERQGKINRGALCSELDIARSVTNQNPAVKQLIAEAEKRWYDRPAEDIKSLKAASERYEKRVAVASSEISKLTDEIAKLKAENSELKRQLERYAAMDEVIKSTGLAHL